MIIIQLKLKLHVFKMFVFCVQEVISISTSVEQVTSTTILQTDTSTKASQRDGEENIEIVKLDIDKVAQERNHSSYKYKLNIE